MAVSAHRRGRSPGWIGHYGCATARRVVSIHPADSTRRGPAAVTLDCPCGSRHIARPTWRKREPGEGPGEVNLPPDEEGR